MMREAGLKIYDEYFSSVDKITMTTLQVSIFHSVSINKITLQIIFSRVNRQIETEKSKRTTVNAMPEFSTPTDRNLTAVILTSAKHSSRLQKIVEYISSRKFALSKVRNKNKNSNHALFQFSLLFCGIQTAARHPTVPTLGPLLRLILLKTTW